TYFDLISVGKINPRPRPRIVRESPSTATVDGDNGLGLVIGPWANDIAMEKAERAGTGWVAVCHTNHFGIAGYYVLEALNRAMIEGGALLPLGSDREHSGHKGYGLALAVDVLSAVLSGANWGPFAPPFALRQADPVRKVGKGIGHFFGAMRIDAFRDPDEFK